MKLSRILVFQSLLVCGFAYFQREQTTLGDAPLNHQSGPFINHALPAGQTIPQKKVAPPPQGVAPLKLRVPSRKAEKPKSELAAAPAPAGAHEAAAPAGAHKEIGKMEEKEKDGASAEAHEEAAPEGGGGALSLSLFLVGGTGALMLIFHLASSSNKKIKVATWRLMNTMTSIFIAVLVYAIVKGIIEHVFEPSKSIMVIITLVLFVLLFVGLHAVLFKLKGGGTSSQSRCHNLSPCMWLLCHVWSC